METKIGRPIQDDDIDLGRLYIKLISLLKKKVKILIVFAVLGFCLGLIYYLMTPPVYYSSMTISTGILTTTNSKSLFSTLETLIQEGNHNVLAKKLNLNIDEVTKINSISVVPLAKSEEDPDKSNLFLVEANITDQKILDRLELGIVYYLEENPYVKKRINIKKKNIEALLGKINEEMLGLDTLKEKLSANINMSRDNNVVILDPVNAYRETVNLFQKELDLQSELELIDNIQVIENFTYFNKKISPHIRYVFFGLFLGIIFGITIIFILELIAYTRRMELLEVD